MLVMKLLRTTNFVPPCGTGLNLIPSDYYGPKRAGLRALLLRRPTEPVETEEEIIKDTIASLPEVLDIIDM
jgi:hypothetical protein